MATLRALVVEDDADWRAAVKEALAKGFGQGSKVDTARDLESARRHLGKSVYDLVVTDLKLKGRLGGMDVLREMRTSSHNRGAAAVVLTGNSSEETYNLALRVLRVFRFMEKLDTLDDARLAAIARAAILDARLRQAEEKTLRPCLTLRFSDNQLLGSELTSPTIAAPYSVEQPPAVALAELAERADNLTYLFRAGAETWRGEMKRIGKALYELLTADPRLFTSPLVALGQMESAFEPWLRFSGPAAGLGIPFEILNDRDSYLSRRHVISRQLVRPGTYLPRKSQPFCQFLRGMHEAGEPLRILLVAANSDGTIPGVEAEVKALAALVKNDLAQLGLACEVEVLPRRLATYQRFKEKLRGSRYHILHYAGHGRRDTALPEVGGLILKDGRKPRTLTAAQLSDLFQGTELRLVFLSSCFGAYSAERRGRGDFHGVLDALAGADVPIIVGHRWAVPDAVALTFAVSFYSNLWRTLSPGDAVLAGRRACADRWGLDVETWASPILLMQSS